jgi:hypothetical protein
MDNIIAKKELKEHLNLLFAAKSLLDLRGEKDLTIFVLEF